MQIYFQKRLVQMTDYTEYKWTIYDCGRKIKCNPFCCRASTINWRLSHQRLYALMITHSGVQTHTCSECKIKKSFGEAGTLRKHMITHTGEKEHKCAECRHLFGQAAHLKMHMLTMRRSYICAHNTIMHLHEQAI